ncbi:Mu-like prophage major head subunit gpT family protein [Sphingopyxis sp. GW247-27LB]|uniref:Mu-like prophage major head subunit gpT family protein n=1 Tax=Sphingopyxis sp. GW247-27LB TaxID=2012632 RepID=UPI001595E428|nr:Mu-like prophage major head subunit gpT family protein [Sphingopyxis sp. GW247-27LB]
MTGFQGAFNRGWEGAQTIYDKIAMKTVSSNAAEAYVWLRELPNIREWVAERYVHGLAKDGFILENRKFESTIRVKRTDIEDDNYGSYSPMLEELGRKGAEFPDELLAELMASGFDTNCYDGQFFFDTDHPVGDPNDPTSFSNVQAGAGPAWYLLDLSRNIRPFIFQQRIPFQLQRLDGENDENVFMKDNYLYGLRGRMNAGFGLWQLAFASKADLTVANYEAARAAMTSLRGENNRKLGIKPTHLVVPTELEGDGRRILKTQLITGGESNPWAESAELLVSQWL